MLRNIMTCILGLLTAAAVCHAQAAASAPASKPATGPAATTSAPTTQAGPGKELLDKIKALTEVQQQPKSKEELDALLQTLKTRLGDMNKLQAELEQKYPGSVEATEGRVIVMVTSVRLGQMLNDPVLVAQAEGMAKTLIGSSAPDDKKLYADVILLQLQIMPMPAPGTAPKVSPDAAKIIRQFVDRHAKEKLAPEAFGIALQMAAKLQDQPLFEELKARVVKDYPDSELAQQIEASVRVGKVFTAELTTLDGKKVKLPDDFKGKVVVVDFWASWCPPCIEELPHMRQSYDKYKAKGVVFVGISLDRSRKDLDGFLKKEPLPWTQTYSETQPDPAVKKYGVNQIPTVFVLDKNGKIVDDEAAGQLDEALDKVLGIATSKPASGPALPGGLESQPEPRKVPALVDPNRRR